MHYYFVLIFVLFYVFLNQFIYRVNRCVFLCGQFAIVDQPLEFVCFVSLAGKKDKELDHGYKRNSNKNDVISE